MRAIKNFDNVVVQGIAEDGYEAIEKLKTLPVLPDLIFMDINMPRMNGLECLAEIRRDANFSQIPVIMLSTSTEEIEVTRSLGAKAYIQKLGDGELLRECLKRVISCDFSVTSSVNNKAFGTDTPNCLLSKRPFTVL